MAASQFTAAQQLRFKDFDFGEMEAEAEASERPDLLLRGFIDRLGMIDEARNGRRFLFLGYKGSGKSGLAEHLSLLDDPQLFVKVVHIADLSFRDLGEMVAGDGEPEARFPTAWSWLLLLQLFDSFSEDLGSNLSNHDNQLWYAVDALRSAGYLPDAKLSKTIEITLKKNASIKLWDLISIGGEKLEKSSPDVRCLHDWLKRQASKVKSESKHLLVIDGLDDLLRKGKLAHTALSCLLFEAKRLNNEFGKDGTPAKVIIVCRTDLFDRLPGANNNKLRQIYAHDLDWSDNLENPKSAALVGIINQRASLSYGQQIDVFDTFLPGTIDPHAKTEIRSQLLEHTRRIPRDMIMLFKFLQKYSGSEQMTPSQVFNGLAAYSKNYLVTEMRDELGGYVEPAQIDMATSLFTKVRKRSVTVGELDDRARRFKWDLDLRPILRVLFDCSLIGNGPSANTSPRDVHFKFKNRYAAFDPSQAVFFHRGLWKGLDLH